MANAADPAGLRIIAALIGVVLLLILARFVRRGISTAVISVLVLSIPIAGFAFFIVEPGPRPYPEGIAWTAFGLLVLAVGLSLWTYRVAAQIRDRVTTFSMLARLRWITIAATACFVLAVSVYLYIFEPLFAVANLVAGLAWVLVWVPQHFRRASVYVSLEVQAPPERAWDFLVDATNARQYEEGLQDLSVSPEGQLRVGSRLRSRRRVPLVRPWLKVTELNMEMESQVTELVPGSSYTVVGVDRGASTTTEVKPVGSGSQINIRTQYVFSIGQGIAGQMFRIGEGTVLARDAAMRSLLRIKELLSADG